VVERPNLGRGFPEWEPVHNKIFKAGILGIENVGGDLDALTGKRCTFAFFPINWDCGTAASFASPR
jgi:kynurenine formamidase